MRGCISLIRSTAQGYPDPAGTHTHWVCVSDVELPAVDQMHIGALYADEACAVAAALAFLRYFGRDVATLTLEHEEGTTPTIGTTVAGLITGLRDNNVACHEQDGSAAAPGWVMNGAWGGNIPPQQCAPYLAASLFRMVVIDQVVPAPQPPTQEVTDMLIVNTPSFGEWFLSEKGYFHIPLPADVQSLLAAGVKAAPLSDEFHRALVGPSILPAPPTGGTAP